jgi:NADH:ubiquinone oxidoreductase subunit 6 (subunit J)
MALFKLIGTVLWLILFVWALLDIIKAHKDTGWKLIWIIVCLAFPLAGVIVYYLFARQKDMNLPQDFQK